MKKNLLIILLYLFSLPIFAQSNKEVTDREQFWLAYFNQTRLSKKWGLWADFHFRTNDFMSRAWVNINRVAAVYYLKDNMRLMAGYAYVSTFPDKGFHTTRPEHRPWQQIWWNQKYNGFTTLQWLRLEERYIRRVINDELTGDYDFNFRMRYNFSLFIPLNNKELKAKTLFLLLQDEIFINFGKEIKYNYFDQNRFFVGAGYQLTSHLNFQVGYMNVFQQRASGNQFYNSNALRFFVFHTLDLRKKEESL